MRGLLLVALAAVLLPACGGEEATPDEASGPAGSGEVVEIALSDFAIQPGSFSLEPGTYTFRVVNDGDTVHALEVEGPGGEVETGDLQPGDSADLDVDLTQSGDYEVYCPVDGHRDRGMEATLTVGGGGAPATTTDETTTEEDGGYGY
jgi:plastocyanin